MEEIIRTLKSIPPADLTAGILTAAALAAAVIFYFYIERI